LHQTVIGFLSIFLWSRQECAQSRTAIENIRSCAGIDMAVLPSFHPRRHDQRFIEDYPLSSQARTLSSRQPVPCSIHFWRTISHHAPSVTTLHLRHVAARAAPANQVGLQYRQNSDEPCGFVDTNLRCYRPIPPKPGRDRSCRDFSTDVILGRRVLFLPCASVARW